MAKPVIEPITDASLPEFAAFLAANMPVKRSVTDWTKGLKTSWNTARPNYGFIMMDGDKIVGGIGALYADRTIRGKTEHFCNITSWCVLDSHRKYSMQLAMSIVGQANYHFTDFSPTKTVAGALQFLKFKPLDEAVVVVPNWPLYFDNAQVISDHEGIRQQLTGELATLWKDHTDFPWLRFALVGSPNHWCLVVYKQSRFKHLRSANIVFASDRNLLTRHLGRLGRHFFWLGMMTTHVERRMLERLPCASRTRIGFNPKQYLSLSLAPDDIDYLYSETVALDL